MASDRVGHLLASVRQVNGQCHFVFTARRHLPGDRIAFRRDLVDFEKGRAKFMGVGSTSDPKQTPKKQTEEAAHGRLDVLIGDVSMSRGQLNSMSYCFFIAA